MWWWFILSFVLTGYYVYLIKKYQRYWKELLPWNIPPDFIPTTKVSVIIPARNEAQNIVDCLTTVCQQNYPTDLYEVILINDHSTDETTTIARSLNFPQLKIIELADHLKAASNQNSFKKQGIAIGIDQSSGELIVTTDADCFVSSDWLKYLVSFYENNPVDFIAATVNFYQEKTILEKFQSLDFMGMMAVTGAGIQGDFMRMCNGANLAYTRKAYEAVDGFKGIDQLASGDDMLLMQKIARQFPGRIGFIKNVKARTLTYAQPTLKSFTNQRIRWASKSAAYPEKQVTFMLAMIFFFCWNILFSLLLIPFLGWLAFGIFLFQFFVKALVDFQFLKMMARFFNRLDLMRYFWASQVLHILYIAGIGLLANFKKEYDWKGRRVK